MTPANGYELSIYNSTPIVFWFGSMLSIIIGIFVIFFVRTDKYDRVATGLAGLSMFATVSLPIIRGYHFKGESDALTHLGYVRDLHNDVLSVADFRYPFIHLLTSTLSTVTEITATHALLLIVSLFVLTFFIFVPLSVRAVLNNGEIVYVSVFSALLILPITNIRGSHMQVHPTSQAIMFIPVILYLFTRRYLDSKLYTPLLLLVAVAFVLLHPQQAANLVIFFAVIAGYQLYLRLKGRVSDRSFEKQVGSLGFGIVILSLLFTFVWWSHVANLDVFEYSLSSVVSTIIHGTGWASSVEAQGISLVEIGGSVTEIILKVFLLPMIYGLFAAIAMAAVLFYPLYRGTQYSRLYPFAEDANRHLLLKYVVVGFIAVSTLFFAYLFGGVEAQYFRHYSFLMVILTVIGAAGLGAGFRKLKRISSDRVRKGTTTFVLILFVLISVPVLFNSPYMYQSSAHVTDGKMSGYDIALSHQSEEYVFDFIRSDPARYEDGIAGSRSVNNVEYYHDRTGVPDNFANQNLATYYSQPVYLTITESDRIRDPVLYQGLRFTADDFAYLDRAPDKNKVVTTGEFDLYEIRDKKTP